MSGIRLRVDAEQCETYAQMLRTLAASAEDMARRAADWVNCVEAGELDADEMFSTLRVLSDQTGQLATWTGQAADLIDGQMTDLLRALGQ